MNHYLWLYCCLLWVFWRRSSWLQRPRACRCRRVPSAQTWWMAQTWYWHCWVCRRSYRVSQGLMWMILAWYNPYPWTVYSLIRVSPGALVWWSSLPPMLDYCWEVVFLPSKTKTIKQINLSETHTLINVSLYIVKYILKSTANSEAIKYFPEINKQCLFKQENTKNTFRNGWNCIRHACLSWICMHINMWLFKIQMLFFWKQIIKRIDEYACACQYKSFKAWIMGMSLDDEHKI